MTLSVQFMTIISMIIGGFYLGIMLDTFRRFTVYWKNNNFLTYFLEIFFWLVQMFILFYILFRMNAGEVRFYIIVACLLGFAMYKALAAPLYKKVLEQVIRAFLWMYNLIIKVLDMIIITPLKWVLHIVITVLIFFLQLLVTCSLFILKLIFYPFKLLFQLAYSLLPNKFKKYIYKIGKVYSILKSKGIKKLKSMMFKRR